jgi:hypothetical protein
MAAGKRLHMGINTAYVARQLEGGRSDHGISTVWSAGGVLRAGRLRLSRAWLLNATTKVTLERRGGYSPSGSFEDVPGLLMSRRLGSPDALSEEKEGTRGFRQSGLQEAFFVPGDHAFRVWGYGTTDPLEEVLRPGYFGAGNMMHPGELIYLRMQAQPPARLRGPVPEPVHMALVMAVGRERNGAVRLRLVQDFGRTDARQAEAAAPLTLSFGGAAVEAPKRQRGRPAGSGTRKRPATNGHDAGPSTF